MPAVSKAAFKPNGDSQMACFKNYSGYSIATNLFRTIAIFDDGEVWVITGENPIHYETFHDYMRSLGHFDRPKFPELAKTVEFAAAIDVWGVMAAIEFFEKPENEDEVPNQREKIAKALALAKKRLE